MRISRRASDRLEEAAKCRPEYNDFISARFGFDAALRYVRKQHGPAYAAILAHCRPAWNPHRIYFGVGRRQFMLLKDPETGASTLEELSGK